MNTATIKKFHKYAGISFSILILTISATGILLNHDKVFSSKGDRKGMKGLIFEKKGKIDPNLAFDSLPVSLEKAVSTALSTGVKDKLEKVEIKNEFGGIVYKVKFADIGKTEVIVDANSGEVIYVFGKKPEKIAKDLHTGKFFGEAWMLLSDITGLAMIVLSLTGLYMWLKTRMANKDKGGRL
ncbi:MAG: PepSY domain-containing protein [Deltaproteobacteria bacterium]|nr:PepSY domain-containing protein [Deltaproteobacteria bacterium]